jgi:hypothetical protein
MSAEPAYTTRDEVIEEVSKWAVGLGILTMSLFPLALPILILTLVALLPLVLPLIALGLVAGILALPFLLTRRLLRAIKKRRAPKGPPRTSEPESGAPWLEGARPVRGSETRRPVVPRA